MLSVAAFVDTRRYVVMVAVVVEARLHENNPGCPLSLSFSTRRVRPERALRSQNTPSA